MQPSEALGVAAQVAVTLAGFAGIVVVFRPDSIHHWSPIDKFRLRLLLANSAAPLILSLFGMLLLTMNPPPFATWRWCSGFSLALMVPFIATNALTTRRIPRAQLMNVNKLLYYSIVLLGITAVGLQVINICFWNQFWPFFFVIFVYLVAAIVQFLRLLLLPPHSQS